MGGFCGGEGKDVEMTVYELIQQLINYPADWQVDIHGAAKELDDFDDMDGFFRGDRADNRRTPCEAS
jgi:hypothetical protein